MKRQFFGSLAASLMLLFIAGSANAQVDSVRTLAPVSVQSPIKLTEKVKTAFSTRFKDAENTRWEKMNPNFLVQFTAANLTNHALFQRNGYMVYHIVYGNEGTLPADTRAIVKENYASYEILGAVEVNYGRRTIWMVTVGDKNRVITLRCEDDQLEEVRNLVNIAV